MSKLLESVTVTDIEIGQGNITPSPYQARHLIEHIDRLAQSIADVGLINPILVREVDGHYELVAGERRWRATRMLGNATITAIVRELTDSQARRIVYEENVQRDDLSKIEEIEAWVIHLDAQLWPDEEYRHYAQMNNWDAEMDDHQAKLRARWLLRKLDSDKANGTDYFMNKFVHKIEDIFSKHGRGVDWLSFLKHDIPLLDLPDVVKDLAATRRLNKSQAKELGRIAGDDSEEAQAIIETGVVTVRDGLDFEAVPIEEASAREIKEAPEVKRLQNRLERFAELESQPLPEPPPDKYRVLYADPPWHYAQVIEKYGPAERHYPTMKLNELMDMGQDVKKITDDNAVLFLWTTAPKLSDALQLVEAWGFRYTGAQFIWDKIRHNYGHYNSVRHELLLICVKGSCTPDEPKLFDSVQSIERSDIHSEKPRQFMEIIDALYTHGNRIELFSRKEVEGWDTWGNEANTLETRN